MLVLLKISCENGASHLFPGGRKETVTGESPLQAGRGNNNMDIPGFTGPEPQFYREPKMVEGQSDWFPPRCLWSDGGA